MKNLVKKGISVSLILCCGYFAITNLTQNHTSQKVSDGLHKLQQLENKDIKDVQRKISLATTKMNQNNSQVPFSQRYQSSVIIGDSIAEALLDYRVLDRTIVLASRGTRCDSLDDQIQSATYLSPQNIFICVGMNDLVFNRGDSDLFISKYKHTIAHIREVLPDANIFINSILPMTSVGYQETKYNHLDCVFNKAIIAMCEEMNITYIDNDMLIDGEDVDAYESDGIHPKYGFYPMWLDYMASQAGI